MLFLSRPSSLGQPSLKCSYRPVMSLSLALHLNLGASSAWPRGPLVPGPRSWPGLPDSLLAVECSQPRRRQKENVAVLQGCLNHQNIWERPFSHRCEICRSAFPSDKSLLKSILCHSLLLTSSIKKIPHTGDKESLDRCG